MKRDCPFSSPRERPYVADENNNPPTEGMPDDLRRLLERAEEGDVYVEDASDEDEDDVDDEELEESFGANNRAARCR